MELTFNKTANGYTADYVATTHFNLHIEGGGRVLLYRRTSGSQGTLLASIPSEVVDVDVAVNHEATYTIVLRNQASLVVITTSEGEVITGVIPEGDVPSGDIPEGYEAFLLSDGEFLAADGAFYVKL
jgi:hypothetical protein